MFGKRGNTKDGSSVSSASDGKFRSPEKKKVKEVFMIKCCSLLDSSFDEILDALGLWRKTVGQESIGFSHRYKKREKN